MKAYATITEISKSLGISKNTVYVRKKGIEEWIKKGRYSPYAISGRLISMAVFLDYEKYRKMLADKNAKKYVPVFDEKVVRKYLGV